MSEKSVGLIERRLVYPLRIVLLDILEVEAPLVEVADIVGEFELGAEAVLLGEVPQLAQVHPLRLVDFVVAHLQVLELLRIRVQQAGEVHVERPVGVVRQLPHPQHPPELRFDADLLEDLPLHAFL